MNKIVKSFFIVYCGNNFAFKMNVNLNYMMTVFNLNENGQIYSVIELARFQKINQSEKLMKSTNTMYYSMNGITNFSLN